GVVLGDDFDLHLVFADADAVAGEQSLRVAAANGLLGVVDVHAVRRGVDDVVTAGPIVDARVAARKVTLPVGQYPVALERAADRATGVAELTHTAFAEALSVTTYDLQAQCHIDP